MTELTGVHVEWHVRVGGLFDKAECRLWVDESTNQPRGGHPVYARTRAGHPTPTSECGRRQDGRSRVWWLPGTCGETLQSANRAQCVRACWRVEEIRSFDLAEALAQSADAAAPLFTIANRVAALRSRRGRQSIGILLQRAIVGVARSLKRSDKILSTGIQRVGGKHRRLAPQRQDFAANPLEVLATL